MIRGAIIAKLSCCALFLGGLNAGVSDNFTNIQSDLLSDTEYSFVIQETIKNEFKRTDLYLDLKSQNAYRRACDGPSFTFNNPFSGCYRGLQGNEEGSGEPEESEDSDNSGESDDSGSEDSSGSDTGSNDDSDGEPSESGSGEDGSGSDESDPESSDAEDGSGEDGESDSETEKESGVNENDEKETDDSGNTGGHGGSDLSDSVSDNSSGDLRSGSNGSDQRETEIIYRSESSESFGESGSPFEFEGAVVELLSIVAGCLIFLVTVVLLKYIYKLFRIFW